MDWTASSYLTYLAITVPLTVWVAKTLSMNGRVFLEDVFVDNAALADAINTLLVVGFYLLNVGFVLLYLRTGSPVTDLSTLMEVVSVKVGVVMVVLGLIHFTNVYAFNAIRRRVRMESLRTPPLEPQYDVGPAQPGVRPVTCRAADRAVRRPVPAVPHVQRLAGPPADAGPLDRSRPARTSRGSASLASTTADARGGHRGQRCGRGVDGAHAWVMCLWATAAHRPLAESLARPSRLPLARGAAHLAAGIRNATSAGSPPEEVTTLTTVPEPAPKTTSAKAEQTRATIVAAALSLFRTGGYDATTMRASPTRPASPWAAPTTTSPARRSSSRRSTTRSRWTTRLPPRSGYVSPISRPGCAG